MDTDVFMDYQLHVWSNLRFPSWYVITTDVWYSVYNRVRTFTCRQCMELVIRKTRFSMRKHQYCQPRGRGSHKKRTMIVDVGYSDNYLSDNYLIINLMIIIISKLYACLHSYFSIIIYLIKTISQTTTHCIL